mmetsp:Transcript_27991/g.45034  ORF Transcript_27991/g.45034 Transcript_27991/m.45034 type:complete len:206 (-) Transcript_27991:697-1314(-)
MYLRYSSRVVAPISWSCPLASIGFIMLPASRGAPPPEPAPTIVCISSIIKIISPSAATTSLRTFCILSSNSPRYLEPASIAGMSNRSTRLSLSPSGTWPSTILCARPSATAVLPTPGSPTRTGLFFFRRFKTKIISSTSLSRPITGSILPSLAFAVKSSEYSASVACLFLSLAGPPPPTVSSFFPFSLFTIGAILLMSTPSFFST